MAPFPIPTLMAQSASAIYTPCKDLFLYLKDNGQQIKELEDRMRTLVVDVISIISRKEEIDRSLRTSISIKKSKEYIVTETDIKGILKKYAKFTNKYASITSNLPILTAELDDFLATSVIDELEEIEPKVWTSQFFTLAKLSIDIAMLSIRASRVLGRLKPEYMIHKKSEQNPEKLDDDSDLLVFNEYVDEVLGYLSGNGNSVGIIGPVGVGKTTVLKKLHNRLIDTKSLTDGDNNSQFDNIIWIEYPTEATEEKRAEKLQTEIMLQLQISHENNNSIYLNADTISKFLHYKKYILLMDHVAENIDLDKLGLRKNHKCGNFVIASSDRKAISLMVQHEVEIQRLTTEDAWKLFENICGKISENNIKMIADRIIEGCGGLPRAIKFVASFLKNKREENSWMGAKRNLQSHTKSVKLMGLGGIDYFYMKRYENLETCYKKCFLYTALFPNEYKIYKDYLIECWMAERFIEEDDVQKLMRTRVSGQTILDQLTDLYLLDWCTDKKYVKMPPNCRRVALELEYPGEEKCVTWVPLDDLKPNEKTWETVTRMSLIRCGAELPTSPECSNIYTLLLQSMPELKGLAESFFLHMQDLQVLDLYHTEIGALPRSINSLVNLKGLYLNSCKHLDVLPPTAAELKKLEFLDICGTSIPSLPQEIGYMIGLRCLRASFSPRICNHDSKGKKVGHPKVIIPLKIIKNLKKLEELSIDTCWIHSQPGTDMAEELAMELASLEYLTTLRFNFPNVSSFNKFVTHSKSLKNTKTSWGSHSFRSFKIFVGCQRTEHPYESDVLKILVERRLRLSTNEEFSSDCRELFKQTCAFELIGDHSVETLSQFDLQSLKVCVIGGCNCLKNIVDGNTINVMQDTVEESSSCVLQNLEKLHLYGLQSLQCIWEGQVFSQSLINLTVLTLNGCPKLTKILDPALARTLSSLKILKVENCCEISQIVEIPEGSENSGAVDLSHILKSVVTVELTNLSKLQSICRNTSINWNSLNSIIISRCYKLSNLSLTRNNAKKLASIKCEKGWWNSLELPDGVKQHLLQFCCFTKEPSVLGARPEGETSTIGTPVFNRAYASSNTKAVTAHRRKGIKQTVSSTCGSIDHTASNMNLDNGTESHGEAMKMQALDIYAEGDSSVPKDDIPSTSVRENFGHLTSIRS